MSPRAPLCPVEPPAAAPTTAYAPPMAVPDITQIVGGGGRSISSTIAAARLDLSAGPVAQPSVRPGGMGRRGFGGPLMMARGGDLDFGTAPQRRLDMPDPFAKPIGARGELGLGSGLRQGLSIQGSPSGDDLQPHALGLGDTDGQPQPRVLSVGAKPREVVQTLGDIPSLDYAPACGGNKPKGVDHDVPLASIVKPPVFEDDLDEEEMCREEEEFMARMRGGGEQLTAPQPQPQVQPQPEPEPVYQPPVLMANQPHSIARNVEPSACQMTPPPPLKPAVSAFDDCGLDDLSEEEL